MMKLVLASASPRRQAFFRDLGWDFQIEVSEVGETRLAGELPEDMVLRLAEAKAADVWSRLGQEDWVVGADTTVAIGGVILGKPSDARHAVQMIRTLGGRTHDVLTGVAVIRPDGARLSCAEKTEVTFRAMTEAEAEAYVEQGESMDKAGAYAIQGKGMLLVDHIKGCYFNVVGLPLERLSEMLAKLGWPLSEQWRVR